MRTLREVCFGQRSDRFDLLLPLRGVLALTVVLHHVSRIDMGLQYARVAMFFVISGYCIFASAEGAVRRGEGTGAWLLRRVVRIWPSYLLALACLGVVLALRQTPYRVIHPEQPVGVWIANVFLVAWTRLVGEPLPVAWQNPDLVVPMHWTLGYEMQFYVLMAAVLACGMFGKRRVALLAVGLGLTGLAANVAGPHEDRGVIADYGLCFALGAGVFYRVRAGSVVARRCVDGVIATALIGGVVAAWMVSPPTPSARNAPAEIAVSAAFAAGLILAHGRTNGLAMSRWLAPLRWLGVISYSLFLIHPINFPFARWLAHAVLPEGAGRGMYVAAQIAWHIVLAVPFWYVCERPVMGWMEGRLRKRVATTAEVGPENVPQAIAAAPHA